MMASREGEPFVIGRLARTLKQDRPRVGLCAGSELVEGGAAARSRAGRTKARGCTPTTAADRRRAATTFAPLGPVPRHASGADELADAFLAAEARRATSRLRRYSRAEFNDLYAELLHLPAGDVTMLAVIDLAAPTSLLLEWSLVTAVAVSVGATTAPAGLMLSA